MTPPPPVSVNIPPPGFAIAPPPIGVVIPKGTARSDDNSNGFKTEKKESMKRELSPAVDEELPQTLHHQENVMIKGSSARHLIMQKLVRQDKVKSVFGPSNLVDDLREFNCNQ